MRLIICAIATGLASCAHGPDVLDIGEDRYSLTASAHVNCHGGSREEALDQATQFCEAKHAKPIVDSFDDEGHPEELSGCSSSIIFRCQPAK